MTMSIRSQRGSISPVLLLLAVGLVALAFLLAPMGLGATLRAGAQTAADAAAVAGAQEMRNQLYSMDHTATVSSFDWALVCAAAEDYAGRNDAELTGCRPGAPFSVVVDVRTHDAVEGGPGSEFDPRNFEPRDADSEGPRFSHRLTATARAEVDPGPLPSGVGGGAGGGMPSGQPPVHPDAPHQGDDIAAVEARFGDLVAYAAHIDGLELGYQWGGGHCCTPAAPVNGPFDCSGAVSAALQHGAGYDIPTAVASQFMSFGDPGPGVVTIYAWDAHVFMSIGGRGWGTGSAPNGGAGWLSYGSQTGGGIAVRHVPEFDRLDPGFVERVLTDVGAGTGPGGGAGGSVGSGWSIGADVRLVPVE